MRREIEEGGLTIRGAMERRGWSVYRLAQEAGIWPSMVQNMLAIEASGDRDRMGRVQASSLLRILEALWPDVQLTDVLSEGDCSFRLVPRNKYQRRRLEGHLVKDEAEAPCP
jgi:transcriptional regulator with XRE-family HTH domain